METKLGKEKVHNQSTLKNILVFSHTPTYPLNAGNRVRIYNLGKFLQNMGHKIHFVYLPYDGLSTLQIREMQLQWDSLNILKKYKKGEKSTEEHFLIDDWYASGIGFDVAHLCKKLHIDVIVVNYIFQSKLMEYIPNNILKIIDTHDKFTDRHKLMEQNGIPLDFFYTTSSEEAKGLKRADIIIAIQEEEAKFFHKIINNKIVTIGHITYPHHIGRKYNKLHTIGFIGSSNEVNVKAINIFIEHFISFIESKTIDIDLIIAGSICDKVTINHESIKLLGFIDDIEKFYQSIDLSISPLLFGSGLKIKTIEALSFGVPIVSTDVSFEGIKSSASYHHFTNIQNMIYHIENIFYNPMQLNEMAELSQRIFKEYSKVVSKNITDLFSIDITKLKSQEPDHKKLNFYKSKHKNLEDKNLAIYDPDLNPYGHNINFNIHVIHMLSKIYKKIYFFDINNYLENKFNNKPKNLIIIQLSHELAEVREILYAYPQGGYPVQTKEAIDPDSFYTILWDFIENHAVDELLLTSEGQIKKLYKTPPNIEYSIIIHVVWSLLNNINNINISTDIQKTLLKARSLFVLEDYLILPILKYNKNTYRFPHVVYKKENISYIKTLSQKKNNFPCRFATLGVINERRNIDFIIDTVSQYKKQKIHYSLCGKPIGKEGIRIVEYAKSVENNNFVTVETKFDYLSDLEFNNKMSETDYIIFAYDEARTAQASGMIYKCVEFGVGIICPDVMPFSLFAQKYPNLFLLYQSKNVAALTDTIDLALVTNKKKMFEDIIHFISDNNKSIQIKYLTKTLKNLKDRDLNIYIDFLEKEYHTSTIIEKLSLNCEKKLQNRDKAIANFKIGEDKQNILINNRDKSIQDLKASRDKQNILINNRDKSIQDLKTEMHNLKSNKLALLKLIIGKK